MSEMMINTTDFIQRDDWLTIENEYFHCHVKWSAVSSV